MFRFMIFLLLSSFFSLQMNGLALPVCLVSDFFFSFFSIPSLPFISALLLRNYFIANKWPINLLCTMSSDVCGVICNVYVMGVLRELLCYKFCNSRLCPEVSSITDACSIQTDYQHTYSVSQTMRTTLFSGILQIIRQV